MRKKQQSWRWAVGAVDRGGPHLELRYGEADKLPYESWTPVAVIGRPVRGCFPVQWLVDPTAPEHAEMVASARRELDYYLVELGEKDPWAYARYHCTTGANMYSSIHWSDFPTGTEGTRISSLVVKVSKKEAARLFGRRNRHGK